MCEKYVAIVEDDKEQAAVLEEYVKKFGKEKAIDFKVSHYYNATMFEAREHSDFDLIFFDIDLPDGNGMEIARKMREQGDETLIVFVTNLKQYAIKGYEVSAFDFIVKPVSYAHFTLKLSSALKKIKSHKEIFVWVKNRDGRFKLNAQDIVYVEVFKHQITYHTLNGDITVGGVLSSVIKSLNGAPFSLCNRCFFVNLKHVIGVSQMKCILRGNIELQISRHKRASFNADLNSYHMSGGV